MLLQQFAHAQERKGYTLKMILPLKLIHRWVRTEITMRTLIEKNVREVSDIMGCPVIETIFTFSASVCLFVCLFVCLSVNCASALITYAKYYVIRYYSTAVYSSFWRFAGQAKQMKVVLCCLDGENVVGSRKDPVLVAYSY